MKIYSIIKHKKFNFCWN